MLFYLIPVLIALLSYVTAGLVGLSLFGRWRGYAGLGLWNLLTLQAVSVATRRRPRERWNEGEAGRKAFVRRFTFLYVLLCLALELVARLPLGVERCWKLMVLLFFYLPFAAVWVFLAKPSNKRASVKQKERGEREAAEKGGGTTVV
jgi:hypothetical protein